MADVLILKGEAPLPLIVQSAGLSGLVVKEALFVLIQHSLASFDANMNTYRLDLNAVLARMAFGSAVAWVVKNISKEAGELLLEIMVAGRLLISTRTPPLQDLIDCGAVELLEVSEGKEAEDEPAKRRKLNTQTANNTTPTFARFRAEEFTSKVHFGQALIDVVKARLNEAAGEVMRAILKLPNQSHFNAFNLAQKLPKGIEFPLESAGSSSQPALHQYLLIMAGAYDFISYQNNAFSFDSSRALRFLRFSLLESFIKARFGQPSARLFRILLVKKMVDERQLTKLSMLSGKEVRERLYQMLKAGLVQLQEIPKSADHAPSRTIYLWTVPQHSNYANQSGLAIFRTAASRHAHALINLRDLEHLERRRHAQLLEKVERTDVAGNLDLLGEVEQRQLAQLKRTLKLLNLQSERLLQDFYILKQ